MSMSLGNSSRQRAVERLKRVREQAKHGDFFFAKWTTSDGYVRQSPCLVVSDHSDPHNEILILKCTTDPGRTEFDVPVTCLREPSVVRANKIYTIQRDQLAFPIRAALSQEEYKDIIEKLKSALCV